MNEPQTRTNANSGLATFGWDKKLRETDDFSSVFRFKCVQRGDYLDIHASPNSLGHARLGLVVPKKILRRAVDRNRIKRLSREVFRLNQTELGNLDVIVRLKAAPPIASPDGSTAFRVECQRLLLAATRCSRRVSRMNNE